MKPMYAIAVKAGHWHGNLAMGWWWAGDGLVMGW